MTNEIFDLYVCKINRFNTDHRFIQEEFANFLNEQIESHNLTATFGRVKHVHIPYLSSELEYKEVGTCIGFVRLTNYEKHNEAADFLWGKSFKGKQIHVFVRKEPTRNVNFKNAYVANDNLIRQSELITENETKKTVAVADKLVLKSEHAHESHSEAVAVSVAASVAEAENLNELVDITKQLNEERERRILAELNAKTLAQKMEKMVIFYEVNENKIRQLNDDCEKKTKQLEQLNSTKIDLENKLGSAEDELKLLKEENEKLRNKAAEHYKIANDMAMLVKKF